MEPRSQLESADQVCMRCQKELIEGDQLNHVGSKFHDDLVQTTSHWHTDKLCWKTKDRSLDINTKIQQRKENQHIHSLKLS